MKIKPLPLIIFFVLIPLCSYSQEQPAEIDQIKTIVARYVTENNIPALSMAFVRDDNVNYINFGANERGGTIEVNEHSIYQIASLGKIMIGIIIKELVIDEKIDLNAEILTYLPAIDSRRAKRKIKSVTTRDLLHHRSGLPSDSRVINRAHDDAPIIFDYKKSDFHRDLKVVRIRSKGEFSYSNLGYAVLAFIAEEITGKEYKDLLSDLTDELGMERTSLNSLNETDLVTPYMVENRYEKTENWRMGKLAPPSAVYSTASDLSKLLIAQLEVYHDYQKEDKFYLTGDTNDAWADTGIKYGYGLFEWGDGGFGHGGDMDGYASEYWFQPKENIGFVILTSSGGKWMGDLSRELSSFLLK